MLSIVRTYEVALSSSTSYIGWFLVVVGTEAEATGVRELSSRLMEGN
jgi:hypothetical protein